MTNQKKFEHTVNVLLKAYLNGTLEHGSCTACAVGNLISHCTGQSPIAWTFVFSTIFGNQHVNLYNYDGLAKIEIESTGYTWKELAKIEFAFETAEFGASNDDYIFNGLMAVVDVLAEIHKIDLTTVKETKELFV
jgi:hypothetical protein